MRRLLVVTFLAVSAAAAAARASSDRDVDREAARADAGARRSARAHRFDRRPADRIAGDGQGDRLGDGAIPRRGCRRGARGELRRAAQLVAADRDRGSHVAALRRATGRAQPAAGRGDAVLAVDAGGRARSRGRRCRQGRREELRRRRRAGGRSFTPNRCIRSTICSPSTSRRRRSIANAKKAGAAGILWMSNRPRRLLYRHNVTLDGSMSPVPGALVEREGAERVARLLEAGKRVTVRVTLTVDVQERRDAIATSSPRSTGATNPTRSSCSARISIAGTSAVARSTTAATPRSRST